MSENVFHRLPPTREGAEVREIRASIVRRRSWLVAGVVAGAALAIAASFLLPPRYSADTTVLVRDFKEGSLGSLSGGSREGGGLSLGGLTDILSLDATLDTEIEILDSRSAVGAVVDSLGLQAELLRPRNRSLRAFFSEWAVDPDAPEQTLHITPDGDGVDVEGLDGDRRRINGNRIEIPGATFVLGGEPLPESGVRIGIRERSDAVRAVHRRLKVGVAGGQVVEVSYRSSDPVLAAAVPNLLVDEYLNLRQTSDRGVNRRRYDFLHQHADSLTQELAAAEAALREVQARYGMLDPEFQGEEEVGRLMELRGSLEENEIELRALSSTLERRSAEEIRTRDLVGLPSLMGNPSVNALLSRIYDLESQRVELADRRTDSDPDVQVLDRRIDDLEAELGSLIRSYHAGLQNRNREIRRELARWNETVDALPARAETVHRRMREVERLSATLVAVQTQLVQARLGAIAEGGDVRRVDHAEVPSRPIFPILWLNLVLGMGGGLFFAAGLAATTGYARRRVYDPWEAEAVTGLPAAWMDGRRPVPMGSGGLDETEVIAVVPSDARVGRATARTAAGILSAQGMSPVIARFDRAEDAGAAATELRDGAEWTPDGALDAASARAAALELSEKHSGVILLFADLDQYYRLGAYGWAPNALLTVPAGALSHEDLQNQIVDLERAGGRPIGIVLERSENGTAAAPVLRRLLRAGRA